MTDTTLAEVWCSRCASDAVREMTVTDGARTYNAAFCADHLWLIVAPRNDKPRLDK